VEETLIKLGLSVYQVGGIIGLLVFFIAILIFLLMTFYARRVSSQAKELKAARDEANSIRDKMTQQLEQMLRECETTCDVKDKLIEDQRNIIEGLRSQITTYKGNEQWFRNEIRNLEDQLNEFRKTRKRPASGRRTEP
jgi:chromosome segregation ATPase